MRLKLILIAIAGLLLSNCYQLKAQSDSTKLTPSHLSAARKLISATGMTDVRFTLMRNNSIKILSANIEEKYREKFVAKLSEFLDNTFLLTVLGKIWPLYMPEHLRRMN